MRMLVEDAWLFENHALYFLYSDKKKCLRVLGVQCKLLTMLHVHKKQVPSDYIVADLWN